MILVQDALRRILQEVPSVPVESISLEDALGRVLAENVQATLDLPRRNLSAMDGYAVRAEDTVDGEGSLRLTEIIAAGAVPTSPVPAGFAAAIMTGAPLPDGADAVVIQEDTDGSQRGNVLVRGKATVGQNIRRRAEDVARGSTLVKQGTELRPGHLGLLASQGLTSVMVSRPPVVAILTTGNELVEPGRSLGPGQIYSANAAILKGIVDEAGGRGVYAGNAMDDPHSVVTRLQWCVSEADIVITSGGVSVGAFDPVKRAFDLIGARVDFWKVAMQPGKPCYVGTCQDAVVIGLPGNPVSALVCATLFGKAVLRKMIGLDSTPKFSEVTLLNDVKPNPHREMFRPCVQELSGLTIPEWQGSGDLVHTANTTGIVRIPKQEGVVSAGTTVHYLPWS